MEERESDKLVDNRPAFLCEGTEKINFGVPKRRKGNKKMDGWVGKREGGRKNKGLGLEKKGRGVKKDGKEDILS